ncbi:unnamed protein product [Ectocarpus sp. CCAP 1310/34]|nr:unnamed protein product [Ectocarpus sp. CCAP 1310/34]
MTLAPRMSRAHLLSRRVPSAFAARAQGLGVRDGTFRAARTRMHRTDHAIPPQEALEKGRYLWAPRKERSDKMDERVMGLARRFWHSDDISRASGNSGEEYHPRRQLMADESTVLTLPAVTKRYKLRVRQASCYCSKCSVGAYDDCVPAKKYEGMVGMVKAVSGKHKVTRASCGVGN